MIQFKRGSADSWKNLEAPLAYGQPGYDKDKNKLKIGNGAANWKDLPYLIGALDMENLLQPESKAAKNVVFTYGKEEPDKETKGQIYLQEYNHAVEVDFVVEIGKNENYYYRRWDSGFMECWGSGDAPEKLLKKFSDIHFYTVTGGYFELKGSWK